MTSKIYTVEQLNLELSLDNIPYEAVYVSGVVSVYNTDSGDYVGAYDDASDAAFDLMSHKWSH